MNFQPELGQMIFGQPHKEHAVPEIMEAVLIFLRYRLGTVLWNLNQKEMDDPFGNSGADFSNETFQVQAYSWNENIDQPWNFKWGDVEVSWYKYLGRGMIANVEISPNLASECLKSCLASLKRMDSKDHG